MHKKHRLSGKRDRHGFFFIRQIHADRELALSRAARKHQRLFADIGKCGILAG